MTMAGAEWISVATHPHFASAGNWVMEKLCICPDRVRHQDLSKMCTRKTAILAYSRPALIGCYRTVTRPLRRCTVTMLSVRRVLGNSTARITVFRVLMVVVGIVRNFAGIRTDM
jgi:hypothetical protein